MLRNRLFFLRTIMRTLQCGRYRLDLSRPIVMGIVNVTPDSFSDGGRFNDADARIAHAFQLLEEGAQMLDIGGESTRPGSASISLDEELARVVPVLRALRDTGVPLSVDTCKPEVMRVAIDEGADMINDIYGFRLPGAREAVAGSAAGLCVMHMKGEPRTMQEAPVYDDVTREVGEFLAEQARFLMEGGVDPQRITVDPGYGFGKTAAQNYELLNRQRDLLSLGFPLFIGVSRKNMIGWATGRPVESRVVGSVVAALEAARRGASILRVHDVAATVDGLKVYLAANQNHA